jgi:tRNA(Ile)-lysidine synthase
VHARRVDGRIWIFRELKAVTQKQSLPFDLWDKRWRLSPPGGKLCCPGLYIGVLGAEGLKQCEDWRAAGVPHAVLLSTPAVWRENQVVAAPLAGWGQKWHAEVDGGEETFFTSLLTH